MVSGHLGRGEPLPEGVGAVDTLLHAQQLLRRGQRRVGVQHPLQPRATATAVRLACKITSRLDQAVRLLLFGWGEAWREQGNGETQIVMGVPELRRCVFCWSCCCCCCLLASFFIWERRKGKNQNEIIPLPKPGAREPQQWMPAPLVPTFALWFWNQTCTTRTLNPVSAASVSRTWDTRVTAASLSPLSCSGGL